MCDELQGTTPFQDGSFEVALAWPVAIGADGGDLAVQSEALERLGAAFAKASGQTFTEVAFSGQRFEGQSAAGTKSTGIAAG